MLSVKREGKKKITIAKKKTKLLFTGFQKNQQNFLFSLPPPLSSPAVACERTARALPRCFPLNPPAPAAVAPTTTTTTTRTISATTATPPLTLAVVARLALSIFDDVTKTTTAPPSLSPSHQRMRRGRPSTVSSSLIEEQESACF